VVPTASGTGGSGEDDRDRCLSGGKAASPYLTRWAYATKSCVENNSAAEGRMCRMSKCSICQLEMQIASTLGDLIPIDHLSDPRGYFGIKPNSISPPGTFSKRK
jgi:hypothetical protein